MVLRGPCGNTVSVSSALLRRVKKPAAVCDPRPGQPAAVVAAGNRAWHRLDRRVEVRIEEQRDGQPVAAAAVDCDAVRHGAIAATGHAVQHIPDIADEGTRQRRSVKPAIVGAHLQATHVAFNRLRRGRKLNSCSSSAARRVSCA